MLKAQEGSHGLALLRALTYQGIDVENTEDIRTKRVLEGLEGCWRVIGRREDSDTFARGGGKETTCRCIIIFS